MQEFLVTSGGISAGKYDYALRAMKTAGVDLRFWKVNIKPGMPFAFGVYRQDGQNVPVFCLPGNPVSSMVTFEQLVRPAMLKMGGRRSYGRPVVDAVFQEKFQSGPIGATFCAGSSPEKTAYSRSARRAIRGQGF
jgi:molybdopterin molybdotransferase